MSKSSNETRNIPVHNDCLELEFLHPTAGTKVAIETTDYTVVILDLSVEFTLPFPRFCNWISTKPCGKTCLVTLIHCAVLNPGLITHIIYFLIVFVVNFLLGGSCEEFCKMSNFWRIYFIGLELLLLRCLRGVVLFIYLECLVEVLVVDIST